MVATSTVKPIQPQKLLCFLYIPRSATTTHFYVPPLGAIHIIKLTNSAASTPDFCFTSQVNSAVSAIHPFLDNKLSREMWVYIIL